MKWATREERRDFAVVAIVVSEAGIKAVVVAVSSVDYNAVKLWCRCT